MLFYSSQENENTGNFSMSTYMSEMVIGDICNHHSLLEKELRQLKPAEVRFGRDSLHFSQGNGGADFS